jgi:uncharacterized protein (DUF302 family)
MPRTLHALMLSALFLAKLASAQSPSAGLVDIPSKYGVDEAVAKIEETARSRGLTIFARIDHSGEAAKAGLSLRNTKLIILGNPKGGTPLMVASARAAIDLPLKVLVWESAAGQATVTINDARWFGERHKLGDDALKPLAGLPGLIEAALK